MSVHRGRVAVRAATVCFLERIVTVAVARLVLSGEGVDVSEGARAGEPPQLLHHACHLRNGGRTGAAV